MSQPKVFHFLGKYASILILFVCVLTGILVRTASLVFIDVSPQALLFFDVPLLTSIDGYYYLNNAKLLLNGTYSTLDPLRAFPEGGMLPHYAPLLSYLVAYIAKFLAVDLGWVATVLPVVLSLLICIPVYGFAKRWGGKVNGYFAVLVTLTAHLYATRTAFGMLDTDCMNVTFPLLISWCYFQFGIIKTYQRYIFFSLGAILSGLFFWWWDIAPSIVAAFALFPPLVAILFFYRAPRKERNVFHIAVLLSLFLVAFLIGFETLKEESSYFVNFFLYVIKAKDLNLLFPNTGGLNLEQEGLNFIELAANSVGPRVLLLISFIGILQLIIKKKTEFLFLLPVLCIGLLSFTSVRFLLFLIPILGLGLGYFVSSILVVMQYRPIAVVAACCLGGFVVWEHISDPPFKTPYFNSDVVSGMHKIRQLTPKNATIIAMWDVGHPLIYWSERATLADGKIHDGERSVYLAVPLISDDYRFSANYMQFFGNHGVPGINTILDALGGEQKSGFKFFKNVLAAGPSQGEALLLDSPLATISPPAPWKTWLEFMFPADGSPVYLFLEERTLDPGIQKWLYRYGTWDTQQRQGEQVLESIVLSPIQYSKGGLNRPQLSLNEETGLLALPEAFASPVPLRRFTWFDGNGLQTRLYEQNNKREFDFLSGRAESEEYTTFGNYVLEVFPPPFVSILQDEKLVDSLSKSLFLYKKKDALKYFRLVDEKRLKYQLWEVKGEQPI